MYLFPSTIPNAANDPVLAILDARAAVEVDAASGAIAIKSGTVFLTKAGVAAMTLALPTAGLPSAGGDDGKTLRIVGVTAQAHTVTTPAAGVNGANTTLTWTAAAGNSVELIAYNGSWYTATKTGVAVS